MRDSQGGGELDPADGFAGAAKRILLPFLSCIGKRTRESWDRGNEVGPFTADKTRKGQFPRGNRKNLAGEGVVRKISSPKRVAGVQIFAMVGASGQQSWIKESVSPLLYYVEASNELRVIPR